MSKDFYHDPNFLHLRKWKGLKILEGTEGCDPLKL